MTISPDCMSWIVRLTFLDGVDIKLRSLTPSVVLTQHENGPV